MEGLSLKSAELREVSDMQVISLKSSVLRGVYRRGSDMQVISPFCQAAPETGWLRYRSGPQLAQVRHR